MKQVLQTLFGMVMVAMVPLFVGVIAHAVLILFLTGWRVW